MVVGTGGGGRYPGTVEAAFFDLDKTVIAKSSVLAFGRPFYREGLLSRRAIVKSAYAQVIFMLVGADEAKMDQLRVAMLADDPRVEPAATWPRSCGRPSPRS